MKEIYNILAAGMGQEQRLDVIANNLANVNSTGFKQDRAVFADFMKLLEEQAPTGNPPPEPSQMTIPYFSGGYTDFSPGSLIPTENNFDLAIEGEGFFEIEGPVGSPSYYTRAGNFVLNAEGDLSTVGGRRVLDGSGGPITIDLGGGEPAISADGEITANGQSVGTIGLVTFDDLSVLTKFGDGLFEAPAGEIPQPAEGAAIRQGFVEGSNVMSIEELVRMIENQRAFEATQKAIQTIDETVGRRLGQILGG